MSRKGFSLLVDAANPGQFLACCGLLDLADRWWPGGAKGWFADGQFHVSANSSDSDKLPHPVDILGKAKLEVLTHLTGSSPEEVDGKITPLLLTPLNGMGEPVLLNSWLSWGFDKALPIWKGNNWLLWSGGRQNPKGIYENLSNALSKLLEVVEPINEPGLLNQSQMVTGRFGFDPLAAWKAVDVGFSPNEQGLGVASSPVTELLAAVGLQRFRPICNWPYFTYHIWPRPLGPLAASLAASNGAILGSTRFRGEFLKRGQGLYALGMALKIMEV